jgi:hypothetical protein
MKKVLVVLIILIILSQPVIAFSIKDILNDFRGIFTKFIEGVSITGKVTQCSDGTNYGKCSITKPLYCNNGVLVNKCNTCGCSSGYDCDPSTLSCVSTQCSDGTIRGACSITKPLYCDLNAVLVDKCDTCGCSSGYNCDTLTHSCVVQNPTQCSDGTLIETCSGIKPLYCDSNSVLRERCDICGCSSGYSCGDPPLLPYSCVSSTQCSDGTIIGTCSSNKPLYCNSNGDLVEKCDVCGCSSGYNCGTYPLFPYSCTVQNPTQCSDGTLYNSCSLTKPLYCDNGILVNKCNTCGCSSGYNCDSTTNNCILIQTTTNCGNGILDSGEGCDYNGPKFPTGRDCNTETNGASPKGSLTCTQSCTISTNSCVKCENNNDCNSGYVCTNNNCVLEEFKCTNDANCNQGYKCISNICVPGDSKNVECEKNADCREGYECISNECFRKPDEPYDPGGEETYDIILLNQIINKAPTVFAIEDQTVKVGESFKVNIITTDLEEDIMDYYFDNDLKEISIGIASCSISENILSCRGIKDGGGSLMITVSDGYNEVTETVNIMVIEEIVTKNNPPVADAGSDILGVPEKEIVLDGSRSYDEDRQILTYKWYEGDNLIGDSKVVKNEFLLGDHDIKLLVTDSEGLTDDDMVKVRIKDKQVCKEIGTIYFPEDTICNDKWPGGNGKEMQINSLEDSCNLFDVCSPELDYLIKESEECCTTNNIIKDPRKAAACNFAKTTFKEIKNCEASYLIKIFGGLAAGPMTGYFDAEMCCKGVKQLCPDRNWLYKAEPLSGHLEGVKCSNTPSNNPYGKWVSNTDLSKNEIALFDAPAEVSVKHIGSGTCTDYSSVLTTLLRKVGFKDNEIYTVEAYDHVYNFIKFDNNVKYHIFDTTGNYEGFVLGNVPSGYPYCEEILRCYNDNGEEICPSNKLIIGCEDVPEKTGRSSVKIFSGINNILKKFEEEIKR